MWDAPITHRDCGFLGLGCNDVAGGLWGFTVGLGESVIDTGGALVVGTVGLAIDVGQCAVSGQLCSTTGLSHSVNGVLEGLGNAAADPGAALSSALFAAADWVGGEHDKLANATSSYEAAREAGHLFGGTEITGLSILYEAKGAAGSAQLPRTGTSNLLASVSWERGELSIGTGFRLSPLGTRGAGKVYARLPHYHFKVQNPLTGDTPGGGSIKRHRPWQSSSLDRSRFDRFGFFYWLVRGQ